MKTAPSTLMALLLVLLWQLETILGPCAAVAAAAAASADEVDAPPPATATTLPVIFCGFGRMGTHSLGAALNRLGYRSLHGEEISVHSLDTHEQLGLAVLQQNVEEMLKLTFDMGYNATLDIHGLFWKDIRAILGHNHAKYIFIVRPFEPYFESLIQTYRNVHLMGKFPNKLIPLQLRIHDILAAGVAHELSVSISEAEEIFRQPNTTMHYERRKRLYDDYVQQAQTVTTTDPDHAIIFNLSEGYPPLCQFLEIADEDCPCDETFPHLSDRNRMTNDFYLLRTIEAVLYSIPMLMLLLLIWAVRKCLGVVGFKKTTTNTESRNNKTKLS